LQEVESAPADKSSWQVGSELMDKSHLTAFLHSQRGQCYIDQQETKMAISDLSAAIEACPGDVPNYMLRGRLYQEQGNPERAIADFRKARLLQRGY
jgi:Tfp pilus assembly protein PilF